MKELSKIETEIDAIFRLMTTLPTSSASNTIIQEKLQTLSEKKLALVNAVESATYQVSTAISPSKAKITIQDRVTAFKKGWKKASPSSQKRLIRNVFDQIIFGEEGLDIFYDISNEAESIGTDTKKKGTLGSTPGVPHFSSRFPFGLLAGGHSDELLRVGHLGGAGEN